MDKTRKMVLRHAHLYIENDKVWVAGFSTNGTRIEVSLPTFDHNAAYCAVGKLSEFLADHVKQQRASHRSIRERLRKGWALVNDEIEGTTP